MTPLKPSEKKMLIILSITGFILLNFVGWGWISKGMLALDRQIIALETREKSLNIWKLQATEAEGRRTWIESNLTTFRDEADRETYLDAFIRQQVQELGLDLRKNQPQEPRADELFIKSRYTAEISGPWREVLQFIYRLQQPKDFRFVPRIQLTSRKAEKGVGGEETAAMIVCSLDIEKWWSPQSVESQEIAEAAANPETPDISSAPVPSPATAPAEQNPPAAVSSSEKTTTAAPAVTP